MCVSHSIMIFKKIILAVVKDYLSARFCRLVQCAEFTLDINEKRFFLLEMHNY